MPNEELEQENKLLKSFLYCTEKSCNNCGYVNCENFQRQRKNCCERWISFKDYIVELEKENAELKRIVKMVAMINKGIYTNEGIKAIYAEAEQFLSEVEK